MEIVSAQIDSNMKTMKLLSFLFDEKFKNENIHFKGCTLVPSDESIAYQFYAAYQINRKKVFNFEKMKKDKILWEEGFKGEIDHWTLRKLEKLTKEQLEPILIYLSNKILLVKNWDTLIMEIGNLFQLNEDVIFHKERWDLIKTQDFSFVDLIFLYKENCKDQGLKNSYNHMKMSIDNPAVEFIPTIPIPLMDSYPKYSELEKLKFLLKCKKKEMFIQFIFSVLLLLNVQSSLKDYFVFISSHKFILLIFPIYFFFVLGIFVDRYFVSEDSSNYNCKQKLREIYTYMEESDNGDIYILLQDVQGYPHITIDNNPDNGVVLKRCSFTYNPPKKVLTYNNCGYKLWLSDYSDFDYSTRTCKTRFSNVKFGDYDFFELDFQFTLRKGLVQDSFSILFESLYNCEVIFAEDKLAIYATNQIKNLIQDHYIRTMRYFEYSHYNLHTHKRFESKFPEFLKKLKCVIEDINNPDEIWSDEPERKIEIVEKKEYRLFSELETVSTFENVDFTYDKNILIEMDNSLERAKELLRKAGDNSKKLKTRFRNAQNYKQKLESEFPDWRNLDNLYVEKKTTTRVQKNKLFSKKLIKKMMIKDLTVHGERNFKKIDDEKIEKLIDMSKNQLCFFRNSFEGLKKLNSIKSENLRNELLGGNDELVKKTFNRLKSLNNQRSKERRRFINLKRAAKEGHQVRIGWKKDFEKQNKEMLNALLILRDKLKEVSNNSIDEQSKSCIEKLEFGKRNKLKMKWLLKKVCWKVKDKTLRTHSRTLKYDFMMINS